MSAPRPEVENKRAPGCISNSTDRLNPTAAAPKSKKPVKSKCGTLPSGAEKSGMIFAAQTMPAKPMGTLIKNTQCQLAYSTK